MEGGGEGRRETGREREGGRGREGGREGEGKRVGRKGGGGRGGENQHQSRASDRDMRAAAGQG